MIFTWVIFQFSILFYFISYKIIKDRIRHLLNKWYALKYLFQNRAHRLVTKFWPYRQRISFPLLTISLAVRRLSRRLHFRALCWQWRERPTSCYWKWIQFPMTTTRHSSKNWCDQTFVAPYTADNRNIINISLFVIHILFLLLRDNLVLLQVGLKSLSYEMQKQEAAYDSNSLFGMRNNFVRE